MSVWRAIGQQLQSPSGLAGRLTGGLMRIVNDKPNRLAVDALQIERFDTVLELGFGPGHAIEMMAAKASAGLVYGLDRSPVMLEQARRRNLAAIRDRRVILYQTGFEALPFADASIDKVLAVNVIYFWRDPVAVLREIRRVLRPGGRVSIYATDAATMRRWKFADPETHHLYGATELAGVLRQTGFPSHEILVDSMRVAAGIQGLVGTIGRSIRTGQANDMEERTRACRPAPP
jgi:ubiquinone/menaquinone biosynthesis C-methylase UbiE